MLLYQMLDEALPSAPSKSERVPLPPVFLSVVIPIYNSARYLAACFEHLRLSEFSSYEFIVVDDGSTDNFRFYRFLSQQWANLQALRFRSTFFFISTAGFPLRRESSNTSLGGGRQNRACQPTAGGPPKAHSWHGAHTPVFEFERIPPKMA